MLNLYIHPNLGQSAPKIWGFHPIPNSTLCEIIWGKITSTPTRSTKERNYGPTTAQKKAREGYVNLGDWNAELIDHIPEIYAVAQGRDVSALPAGTLRQVSAHLARRIQQELGLSVTPQLQTLLNQQPTQPPPMQVPPAPKLPLTDLQLEQGNALIW